MRRLVASSMNTKSVHGGPRSSNHPCSEPSICTSSPTQSRLIARLVNGLEPLPPVAPEAVSQHPLPDRLDPEMEAVSLSQLLAGKCRTEVGVVGRDQSQRLSSERRRIAVVARLAAARRDQRRRPSLP